jgi:hypothetical protein
MSSLWLLNIGLYPCCLLVWVLYEGAVVVLLLFQKKPQKDDRPVAEIVDLTVFEGFVPHFIDCLSS